MITMKKIDSKIKEAYSQSGIKEPFLKMGRESSFEAGFHAGIKYAYEVSFSKKDTKEIK